MRLAGRVSSALDQAVSAIGAARTIVATGHINPDGDALGSALGLALAARDQGRVAQVGFGGDFGLADHYRFLDLSPLANRAELTSAPDVLVAFDVGNAERIGEIAQVAQNAGMVVVVDHHPDPSDFGDIQVVDPTSAAAAQLCFELLRRLDWTISPATADALLLGLVTDTGRFQFANTTAATLATASQLVDLGARPAAISQAVYESTPFGFLGLAGAVLSRAVLDEEHSLVWSYVTLQDLHDHNLGRQDIDGLIDAIRVAREAEVALLVKEERDGTWRASLRSRSRVDVSAIARAQGGGGHRRAAGFGFSGTPPEVAAFVCQALAPADADNGER